MKYERGGVFPIFGARKASNPESRSGMANDYSDLTAERIEPAVESFNDRHFLSLGNSEK